MKTIFGIVAIVVLVFLGVALPLDGEAGGGWLRVAGRFHVLVLHLPISLVLLAPLLEVIARKRGNPTLAESVGLIWGFAAVTAFVTASLGLLLAANEGYAAADVFVHKWGGVSVAVIAITAYLLRSAYLERKTIWVGASYKAASAFAVVAVIIAAHAGGSLVHGKSYLTAYVPESTKQALNIQDSRALNEFAGIDPAFDTDVRPLIEQYCFECHGPDKQNGSVRLDALNPDMLEGSDASRWHEALDMINSGEMPPDKARQHPTNEERREIVAWMTSNLEVAADATRSQNQTVLRRLTKQQYTNTLQELLRLPVNFGADLPDDGKSAGGFSNNGEVLQVSPLHLEYYLAIAREALDAAIVAGEQPAPTRYRVSMGSGVGKDQTTAEFRAYQSVPLSSNDFRVDILDANGDRKDATTPDEAIARDEILGKFGVGQRGSDTSRFWMSDEGMVLFSALPHREKAPKSWQGPSPNLKLQLQRIFPDRGDVLMRVKASRGFFPNTPQPMMTSSAGAPALLGLDGDSNDLLLPENSMLLKADEAEDLVNLHYNDGDLIAEDLTIRSTATFKLPVPAAGVYQFDVVYRKAQEPNQTLTIRVDGAGVARKSFDLGGDDLADHFVTSVGVAYLEEGDLDLVVLGRFFIGVRYLVATPLPVDHELSKMVMPPDLATQQKYAAEHPSIKAFAGTFLDDGMDYAEFGEEQIVDAPAGEAKVYEFKGRLENLPIPEPASGDTERLSGISLLGFWNNYLVKDTYAPGPPLLIESVEIEAPYYETWPPPSHTAIFQASDYAEGSDAYTREILASFMARAFRRAVSKEEVDHYFDFWRSTKDEFSTYEDSVKEVLVSVLASPSLIFLNDSLDEAEAAGQSAEWALANRLAYFLWNSPPDAELMSLAAKGKLRQQLEQQVGRMIADEKSWHFVRAFGSEWLRLDRLETMTVNVDHFPEYTRFVKADMQEETYQLLHHVLATDASIFDLIDSDFAMLNQNLAEFYGIDGVRGNDFRPVPLEPGSGRGGLLSQGSFLTGHSDGTSAHTVKRAVWIKESILGDPPPPPPPNVPDLDPETPGFENLTLKQQLEVHRDDAACRDCHANIDPYGIVFEEYNAVGLPITGEAAANVDSFSTLVDGTELHGVADMKAYILGEERDAFARSLVEHLFAYALGRNVSFADDEEIAGILESVRSTDYRMTKLVQHIVTSDSFSGGR